MDLLGLSDQDLDSTISKEELSSPDTDPGAFWSAYYAESAIGNNILRRKAFNKHDANVNVSTEDETNFLENIDFKELQHAYPDVPLELLAESRSSNDVAALAEMYRHEKKYRDRYQNASGWDMVGAMAGMMAGDPTVLLPPFAFARTAKTMKGMAYGMAAMGATTTLGEGINQLGIQASTTQKTAGESALDVALVGLFGTVLGAGSGFVSSKTVRNMADKTGALLKEEGIAYNQELLEDAVSGNLSAAKARKIDPQLAHVYENIAKVVGGDYSKTGFTGAPAIDMALSASPTVKQFSAFGFTNNLAFKNDLGEDLVRADKLEDMQTQSLTKLNHQTLKPIYDAYYEMAGIKGRFKFTKEKTKSATGSLSLTIEEFNKQLGEHVLGLKPLEEAHPAMKKAVTAARNEIERTFKAAESVEYFDKAVKYDPTYLTRHYNIDKIGNEVAEAGGIVRNTEFGKLVFNNLVKQQQIENLAKSIAKKAELSAPVSKAIASEILQPGVSLSAISSKTGNDLALGRLGIQNEQQLSELISSATKPFKIEETERLWKQTETSINNIRELNGRPGIEGFIDEVAMGSTKTSSSKARALTFTNEEVAGYLDLESTISSVANYSSAINQAVNMKKWLRQLGFNNITDVKKSIAEDYQGLINKATKAGDAKGVKKLKKKLETDLNNVEDFARIMTGTLGQKLKSPIVDKFLGTFMTYNILTMLGAVVISSIPDFARVIVGHPAGSFFKAAVVPQIKKMFGGNAKLKLQREQLFDAGLAVDASLSAMLDMVQSGRIHIDTPSVSRSTKAVLDGFGKVTGTTYWNRINREASAMMSINGTLRTGKKVAEGLELSVDDKKRLSILGLHEDEVAEMWNLYKSGPYYAPHESSFIVSNLDNWPEKLRNKLVQSTQQEIDGIILLPRRGDVAYNYRRSNIGRAIFQFRTFSSASAVNYTIPLMQNIGAGTKHGQKQALVKGIQWLMSAISLGALSVAIKEYGRTGEVKERSAENWVQEGLLRSGVLGLNTEMLSALFFPYSGRFAGEEAVNIIGGPVFGRMRDAWQAVQDARYKSVNRLGLDESLGWTGDESSMKVRDVKQWLPLQNALLISQAMDAALEAAGLEKKQRGKK